MKRHWVLLVALFIHGELSPCSAAPPAACIDPAVTEINYHLQHRRNGNEGTVLIDAIVKNVGNTAYTSSADQQSVRLFRQFPGSSREQIAEKSFVNLGVGGTVVASYIQQWDTSSSSYAEFPPSFTAEICYSPDILPDGNPNNDDCIETNNVLTRSGMAVNDLFPEPWAPTGEYMVEFSVNGEARRFLVRAPAETTALAPAMVHFHGRGTSVDVSRIADNRRYEADWPEAYLVYGEGTNFDGNTNEHKLGWVTRFPCIYNNGGITKGIQYVDRIFQHLRQTGRVNMDLVFANGHSSGAFFTLSLMELKPDFCAYAALGCYSQYDPDLGVVTCRTNSTYRYAPNSGTNLWPELSPVATPKPVLYTFGTNDHVFDTNGSDRTHSYAYKTNHNEFSKCNRTLIELTSRNKAELPGSYGLANYMTPGSVAPQIFPPTDSTGAEVQFRVYNDGHSWPNGATGWVTDFFKSFWHRYAPMNLTPTGMINTTIRPTFDWDDVPGASWYRVHLRQEGGTHVNKWVPVSTWTIGFDLPSGDYRWWVQHWSAADGYGHWSARADFSIPDYSPDAAMPVSPAGALAVGEAPLFHWHAADHADWHHVWVSRIGAGKYADKWIQAPGTNWIPTVRFRGGDYQWWVAGYNTDGYGPWSTGTTFSVVTMTPDRIELISPTGGVDVSVGSIEHAWQADDRATWYNIWSGTHEGHQTGWLDASIVTSGGVARTSLEHTRWGKYDWYVRGWGPDGMGTWSPRGQFTCGSPTPMSASPEKLTWDDSQTTSAHWYQIQVDQIDLGRTTERSEWFSRAETTDAGGGYRSVALLSPISAGSYVWSIQAWSSVNGMSPRSETQAFIVP